MNIGNKAGRARSVIRRTAAAGSALGMLAALAAAAPAASASSFVNWPSYLDGLTHQSYAAQATAITPSNGASLVKAWNFMPGAPPVKALGYDLNASPTVYDGMVYIGGNNGTFYAINETTGAVVWQRAIGYVNPTKGSCGPRGITSTATIAPGPTTGVPTVYVSSGSGYLYAMNASTGAVTWKSVIHLPDGQDGNYYDWSSPTVVNQKIYVGTGGYCIHHVRGAMAAFSQATGKRLATYYTVPSGQVGGSVWSTAAVASDGDVFFGTGNVLAPTPPNAFAGKRHAVPGRGRPAGRRHLRRRQGPGGRLPGQRVHGSDRGHGQQRQQLPVRPAGLRRPVPVHRDPDGGPVRLPAAGVRRTQNGCAGAPLSGAPAGSFLELAGPLAS
jgi:outer membrane protein assembly factor BamB